VLTRYAIGQESVYSSLEGGLATGDGWFKSFTMADLSDIAREKVRTNALQGRHGQIGIP